MEPQQPQQQPVEPSPQPYQPPTQPSQPTPPAPQFTPPPVTPPQYAPPVEQQPYAPPSAAPNKKLLLIIAAAVIVIAGVVVWFFFLRGSSPLAGIFGTAEVVNRSDDTLDVSSLIDSQATIKNQDIKAGLHQQINLNDGTSYMVTGVQRNFTATTGSFIKAHAGKELIKVSVVVGNRDKQNSIYVTGSMFKLKNSAGGLQSPEFIDQQDTPDALVSGDLAAGKQTKGAIVFEVDANEKNLSLVLENKYEGFGDASKKATLHSEVKLD